MIEYDQYSYTKNERIRYGIEGGVGGFLLLMLFYNHVWFCLAGSVPTAVVYMKIRKKALIERRKWELTIQFKDAMESMVSALAAGYSLEHAVQEAEKELRLMYTRDDSILREFSYMSHQIELKVPVEVLMKGLGRRSGIEDIVVFSEILWTAKRTGGNLVQVMKRTVGNISDKIEIKREIETLISGKKMEANCMTAIPLLMIVYLRAGSPGFLDPLYHNVTGVIVMTGALLVYAVSFIWGRRTMNIKF